MTQKWNTARINAWHNDLPWLAGCNFYPSTAINQIEMWSADTFDETTIARELGWAADLGFNLVRVYLHDIPWKVDAEGFKSRVDRFLALAYARDIRVLLTIFDDCWFEPQTGKQPEPRPGIHNSGWVRSPGETQLMDESTWPGLESYVRDIGTHFKNDARIVAWDVYNEVANYFLPVAALSGDEQARAYEKVIAERPAQMQQSLKLMQLGFQWLREVGVSQPLTAPIWLDEEAVNEILVRCSDFVSFHHYGPPEETAAMILNVSQYGRPLWCTEYLSRPEKSCFETHLPIFKQHKIAAINWGLVDGKSQTKYAWGDQGGGEEPELWFHDVLHTDGTPYKCEETEFVKDFMRHAAAPVSS